MRKRILLAIGLTLIGMLVIISVATRFIILDSFEDLERGYMEKNVRVLTGALENAVETVDGTVKEWAEWDETRAFMRDGNIGFINRHLTGNETFENLGLNFMLFADASAGVIFKKAVDLGSDREVPFPPEIERYISRHHGSPRADPQASAVSGLALVQEGPLILASRPVLEASAKGPTQGILIMGSFLDAREIQRLSQRTGLAVTLEPLPGSHAQKDFQEAAARLTGKSILVRPLSMQVTAGYTLLRDVDGDPVLIARVEAPRDIVRQGARTVAYLLLCLALIGVAFGAVILVLLEKTIVSRLHSLSAGVLTVGTSNDMSLRLSLPGTDELAYLAAAINGMLDALKRSTEDLRKSEARNEALLAAVPDIIIRLSEDGTVIDFRWPAGAPQQPPPHSLIGKNFRDLASAFPFLSSETAERGLQAISQSASLGVPQSFEFRSSNRDGARFFKARVVSGGEKETVFFIHDMTAEKKAAEAQRQEILLKEIHHRVKNNLQVISSLLDLQARRADDPRTKEVLHESRNRIRSMTIIHEKLYAEGGSAGILASEYIRDLATHLRSSYSGGSNAVELAVDVKDISLDLDIAVPCGLIINELISNALKYAFPDGRRGMVSIGMRVSDGGVVEVEVADDGIGLPADLDFASPASLGLRIVNILARQLQGTITLNREGGTRVIISFPLPGEGR